MANVIHQHKYMLPHCITLSDLVADYSLFLVKNQIGIQFHIIAEFSHKINCTAFNETFPFVLSFKVDQKSVRHQLKEDASCSPRFFACIQRIENIKSMYVTEDNVIHRTKVMYKVQGMIAMCHIEHTHIQSMQSLPVLIQLVLPHYFQRNAKPILISKIDISTTTDHRPSLLHNIVALHIPLNDFEVIQSTFVMTVYNNHYDSDLSVSVLKYIASLIFSQYCPSHFWYYGEAFITDTLQLSADTLLNVPLTYETKEIKTVYFVTSNEPNKLKECEFTGIMIQIKIKNGMKSIKLSAEQWDELARLYHKYQVAMQRVCIWNINSAKFFSKWKELQRLVTQNMHLIQKFKLPKDAITIDAHIILDQFIGNTFMIFMEMALPEIYTLPFPWDPEVDRLLREWCLRIRRPVSVDLKTRQMEKNANKMIEIIRRKQKGMDCKQSIKIPKRIRYNLYKQNKKFKNKYRNNSRNFNHSHHYRRY